MKNLVFIAFIFLSSFLGVYAQKADSLQSSANMAVDSIAQIQKSKLDSVGIGFHNPLDTLDLPQLKAGNINSIDQRVVNKLDSLQQKLNNPLPAFDPPQSTDFDSTQMGLKAKFDSLHRIDPELINLDSAKQSTQAKVDSLKALKLPHEKYTQKLDSLQQNYDRKVNEKVADLEQRAESKVSVFKDKITGKVDGVHDVDSNAPKLPQAGDINLPGSKVNTDLNLPNQKEVRSPSTDFDLDQNGLENRISEKVGGVGGIYMNTSKIPQTEGFTLPDPKVNTDLGLPNAEGVNLPIQDLELDQTELNTDLKLDQELNTNLDIKKELSLDLDIKDQLKEKTNINTDQYTQKLDKVKNTPKEQVDKVKIINGVRNASDKLNKSKEITGKAGEYQEELAKVKEGDLDGLEQRAEDKAVNLKEAKLLKEQQAEFENSKLKQEEYKEEIEQYQDKEFLQQEVQTKAREMAVEHFARHQNKLTAAQEKLSVYKRKYKSLSSIKDISKNKPNAYRGKSLKERLTPGFNMEVQRSAYTGIDLAPFIGYKLNDHLSIYGSYLYRFNFDNDAQNFLFEKNTNVHGPRIFGNYQVYKGFYGTLALDHIRTSVFSLDNTSESKTNWVTGGFIGIGKRYKFAKRVVGSIQGLYNFLHNSRSPYKRPYNIRIGFELEMRKKPKSRNKKLKTT
ncbi:MAG: hypothetical protein AAF363_07840 [Bacteroidota bacterium]